MIEIEYRIQHAIEYLVFEWARLIDENRIEDAVSLLIEEGEYRIASRFNADRDLPVALVHCKTRAQLRDRIVSMRVANVYETHHYRHLVAGVQIIGFEDGVYDVRSSYTVIRIMEHDGAMAVFSTGQYRDQIVIEAGIARFRRRHVLYDSRAIDTLLVVPL